MGYRLPSFLLLTLVLFSSSIAGAADARQADARQAAVVIYGGTPGGVMAAVQVARMGRRALLIEPGRHLGGMTASGLGATDYGRKDSIGGLAREFYRRVKAHYAAPAAWRFGRLEDFRSHGYDPAEDVMWLFEPHVAEGIFNAMLKESGGAVILGERLDLRRGVHKNGSRIESITMESGRTFRAAVFIDATYEGDLMARAGVAYAIGREANAQYGETLNGAQAARARFGGHNFFRPVDPYVVPGQPGSGLLFGVHDGGPGAEGQADRRVQAYCFRLCLTNEPTIRVPFPKPDGYDASHYELLLRYLKTEGTRKVFPDNPTPRPIEHPGLGYRPGFVVMPNRKLDMNSKGAISANLVGGSYDYPDGDYATRERITKAHERWQKGMMWFLTHDARVPEQYRRPMQEWGLAADEFPDSGHWPFQLYVREARRMVGAAVMTQHDCEGRGTVTDGVGLGSYGMDSHMVQRYVDRDGAVQNEGNLGGAVRKPYPIGYRSLIPRRDHCTNLLVPVCMSATHVAYGSIRMEPVFMILGQSAGAAAVLAIDAQCAVQDVTYPALRRRLLADRQILEWP